jgi:hypothetical protein
MPIESLSILQPKSQIQPKNPSPAELASYPGCEYHLLRAKTAYFLAAGGGFFKLVYTASINISVVQGPVFAPKRVS